MGNVVTACEDISQPPTLLMEGDDDHGRDLAASCPPGKALRLGKENPSVPVH